MKRAAFVIGAAVISWAFGYTQGMHSGTTYTRDAWARAARRNS